MIVSELKMETEWQIIHSYPGSISSRCLENEPALLPEEREGTNTRLERVVEIESKFDSVNATGLLIYNKRSHGAKSSLLDGKLGTGTSSKTKKIQV